MQAVRIWADEEPDIPLVQTPSLLLFNTTYWTDWPTADNNYVQPPDWWEHFLKVLVEIEACAVTGLTWKLNGDAPPAWRTA